MDLCHKSFVPTFSGVGGGGGGGTRTREEEEGGITIPCYGGLAQKCFFFQNGLDFTSECCELFCNTLLGANMKVLKVSLTKIDDQNLPIG